MNNMDNQNQEKPCREVHKVNGVVPTSDMVDLDGKNCDCGRLTFYKQRCNCPSNVEPTYELKSRPASEGGIQ